MNSLKIHELNQVLWNGKQMAFVTGVALFDVSRTLEIRFLQQLGFDMQLALTTAPEYRTERDIKKVCATTIMNTL